MGHSKEYTLLPEQAFVISGQVFEDIITVRLLNIKLHKDEIKAMFGIAAPISIPVDREEIREMKIRRKGKEK